MCICLFGPAMDLRPVLGVARLWLQEPCEPETDSAGSEWMKVCMFFVYMGLLNPQCKIVAVDFKITYWQLDASKLL